MIGSSLSRKENDRVAGESSSKQQPEFSTFLSKLDHVDRGNARLFGTVTEDPESMHVDPVSTTNFSRENQHEILYNKMLPYGERIPEEAAAWIAEIKENLAKCVLAADYRPGVFFWITRLESYIGLYGRLFSKEDHVNFIKLFMELMLEPSMDPSLINRFIKINNDLMKKLQLLSPEDLTMDWKPLYKLLERISSGRDQSHGVLYWPDKTEESLMDLIGYCRYYFHLEATQEMLDEWRPMLCPFDDSMSRAVSYLSTFLPTMLKPSQAQFGYQLWLEEFMGIWLGFHGVPTWEANMLQLLSRVAAENIGFISWDKYISAIFTKFLRALELPVGKKQLQLVYTNESFDGQPAVLWPVAMLHLESCLIAMERLFKSVESYFHPSNYGNWTDKLSSTLMLIPVGLVARLQLERFRPRDWMPEIPKEACLSDVNIVRFVRAFKPLAFLNLFSKHSAANEDAVSAIRHLALMAPDEIFPDLLDKFYASVETLTEPLRFQAIVAALASSLPFIFNYKDGKKHVVPLMLAMLPGIDSNDTKKTYATLGFFSTFVMMLPLRPCIHDVDSDSSRAADAEHEICSQSAEFEDILLQLLDRCLTLVDNWTVEPGARTDVTKHANVNVSDVSYDQEMIRARIDLLWHTIFIQAEDSIINLLFDKIFTSASTQIYPIQQLGAIARSHMGMLAMKIRPDFAKPVIFHRLIRLLEIRLEERANFADVTNLDDELLWTLRIVSDLSGGLRRCAMEYMDRFKSILRRTLMMKCQTGHKIACQMARSVLATLLRIHPINYYEPAEKLYGADFARKSPLEFWGKKVRPEDVKLEWYIPDEEVLKCAAAFFEEFIVEPLQNLEKFASGDVVFDDKQIQKHLHIVEALLGGVSSHCSFDWQNEVSLPGVDLSYPKQDLPITMVNQQEILLFDQPVRQVLAARIHAVVDKILTGQQDETKSLKTCLVIYKAILLSVGSSMDEIMFLGKAIDDVKKELENRLTPKKSRYRTLFIEKARFQHDVRCVYQRASKITKTRYEILRHVIKLSVSRYKEVRNFAQAVFSDAVSQIHLSYRYLLPEVLHFLETSRENGPENNDAQLKGSLYLLLGSKKTSYILKHDWDTLAKVFPAIVRAQHSELPTVAKLLDSLAGKCEGDFVTTGITFTPNIPANKVAGAILRTMNHELEVVFDCALKFQQKLEEKNLNNARLYQQLVNDLVTLLSTPQIRLKNFLIGHVFLSFFVRNDIPPPLSIVQFTLDRLLDSNDKTRRSSVLLMISILRAIKPTRKKIRIQPCHNLEGEALPFPTTVGIRVDNLWICFNEDRLPKNGAEYDNTLFIDKLWMGYYGWPKSGLEVSAPISQQCSLEDLTKTRSVSLQEIDQLILERFSDAKYVEALLKFVSAEDFTHADFDTEYFLLFRGCFRHCGDAIVPIFLPHLRQYVAGREEHQQRAAAEILTGMIRGAKRWPFGKVSKLWADLVPIFHTALNNITGETQGDWSAFSANSIGYGDMRQTYPLLQSVMQLSTSDTGFQTSSKLAVIHSIFECADWRRRDLYYKVLDLIEPRLTDSYRDHVAFLLSVCFRHDVKMPNLETRIDQGPRAELFFNKYYPKCLELLVDEGRRTTLGQLNLFKTIVKTIVTHVASLAALKPDLLQFYPLLCRFENDSRDADLAKDCVGALTCFSQVFLSENAIPKLLQEVRSVVVDSVNMPWRARVVALDNLQICVFNNLLTILENNGWVGEITALIRDRLLDEQIEVRQMASVTLTGFIQCNFIPLTESVIVQFRSWSLTPLAKDRTSGQYSQAIIRRHAGVLGLSSCVAAHPYEVPPLIPQVLMDLGEHINDPPPISATVRSTFSEFRRTHHDTWREQKEKFSDDQLALLTDLLVSANYYA